MNEPLSERENHLVAFFGDQSSYYLEEYRHQHIGRKWSFNLGSFFFGFLWFIYRKMYVLALGFFLLTMMSSQLEVFIYTRFEVDFQIRKAASYLVPLIWAFASGFSGNYFYARHATTKVDAVIQTYPNEEQRLVALKHQGGTTNLVYLVAAILILFYFFLLS
ncbi:MAG TPA: DUF2628 domain-containing protein [Cyclobacteriaceae bacterium]